MKKSITLFCLLAAGIPAIKAQGCAMATSLAGYTEGNTLSQTSKEAWYAFIPTYGDMFLDVIKKDTTFHWVDSVFAYGGSCGSLTLLNSWGRPLGGDSINYNEVRLLALNTGSTYYIKMKLKANPTYQVKYGFYFYRANASTCNFINNGDFENLGPQPCFATPGAACLPGAQVIPAWQSGGYGIPYVTSFTCAIPNYAPAAHSGYNVGCLAIGSFFFLSPPSASNYTPVPSHTYLQTALSTPLQANKRYYTQFFYAFNGAQGPLFIFQDGLGMYLSAGTPTSVSTIGSFNCALPITPSVTPQFQNPSGSPLNNFNWLPMAGVYTPVNGGEDHITIGNFKPSSATNFTLNNGNGGGSGIYIDDVSITPLDFTIPNASICQGMSIQLNPTACTPPYCTSTYTWLPATGLSNANVLSPMASPSVNTTYTLTQTITNALGATVTSTAQVTISVTPATFAFSAGATSQIICSNLGQSAVTLTASSASQPAPSYTWQPSPFGGVLGSTWNVTPTVTTIYTVYATYGGNYGCVLSNTVSVNVSSVCCTQTTGALTSAILNGANLSGPVVINQDILITGNNAITKFTGGEFLMAPNVRITVASGSHLEMRGVHLYACSSTMWQGIDVQNNGVVVAAANTNTPTFIEDAIVAININNVNSVPTYSLAELHGAIFNKNYIAVSVINGTNNAVPVFVENSVFTSRTLTFTANSWPGTGTTGQDLRAAINPTTGLNAPYTLQNAPISNLKAPFNNQPGHMGIRLVNVGNTTGMPSYGVDLGISTSNQFENFNLFDALGYGIYGSNANIHSVNNVFQNSQRYVAFGSTVGGVGIYHECTTLMNTSLDLRDPNGLASMSSGNRFWNCHYGVQGANTFQFYVQRATVRSSQSNQNTAGLQPGNTGFYVSSNRFSYVVSNSNFNNINTCINMPILAGSYNVGSGTQSGIYASGLGITDNYFGAQVSSSVAIANQYVNTAISLSSPNNTGWQQAPLVGLGIQSNNINRAYRGISINGFNGYGMSVNTNSVVLVDDIINGGTQRGIELVNTLGRVAILTNTLSGSGTNNTNMTMNYCGSNAGTGSPSVTCNYASNAYQGFEFNSSNTGAVWKGNSMKTLGRGMVLSSNGQIGQQGASGAPTDNQWTGAWTGTLFCTWTDGSSNAINSKLFIRSSGGVYAPSNNNGIPVSSSYQQAGAINTTTGSYACASPSNPPPAYLMAMPADDGNVSEDMAYSSSASSYRFLDENPAQLDSSQALSNYYDSLSTNSIGAFKQVEDHLYNGQKLQAASKNATVMPANNAEANYQQYYQLYQHYLDSSFTHNDSLALYSLANLCPGSDGPVVYQARALYNAIYRTVVAVTENCDNVMQNNRAFATNKPTQNWKLDLYPNPTSRQLTLRSNKENEAFNISIKDLGGRLMFSKNITLSNYTGQLDLNLAEGLYLITISNNTHEPITKKLVIAR